MHKFFCNYNKLTERYELSRSQGMMFNRVNIQAENTLLPQIKSNLQKLYELIVLIKEQENDENKLAILDETELLVSNLFHSLFSSPLELPRNKQSSANGQEIRDSLSLVSLLERDINIPEYNRMMTLIKNNLSSLL